MYLVIDTTGAVAPVVGVVVSRHVTMRAAQTASNVFRARRRRRKVGDGPSADVLIRQEYIKRRTGQVVEKFHINEHD